MKTNTIDSVVEVMLVPRAKEFGELDKESSELYLAAKQQVALVEALVITPFEEAVKASTGYTNDNLPRAGGVTKKVTLGDTDFEIKSVTSSNPKYKVAVERFNGFLDDVGMEATEGVTRPEVKTRKGDVYVSTEFLGKKLEQHLQHTVNPTLSQSIDFVAADADPSRALETLSLDINADYGELTGENAQLYVTLSAQAKALKRSSINPFPAAVKEGTGYSKENIPAETEVTRSKVGDMIVQVVNAPKSEPKYAKVVAAVREEITECNDMARDEARQNGMMCSKGQNYLPLSRAKEIVCEAIDANTSPALQQNVTYLHPPKNAKVLVA